MQPCRILSYDILRRMYRVSTPGYRKSNQAMRWALPDRVFFACGACHILAYAFLNDMATGIGESCG